MRLATHVKWTVGGLLIGIVCVVVAFWALVPPRSDPFPQVRNAATGLWMPVQSWFSQAAEPPRRDWTAMQFDMPGTDPEYGAILIEEHGCGACHQVPGMRAMRGTVGPPLRDLADRSYIAGVLPNQPGNMISWLVNPAIHSPTTAMPDLGLTEAEAADIAAYLYAQGGPDGR